MFALCSRRDPDGHIFAPLIATYLRVPPRLLHADPGSELHAAATGASYRSAPMTCRKREKGGGDGKVIVRRAPVALTIVSCGLFTSLGPLGLWLLLGGGGDRWTTLSTRCALVINTPLFILIIRR